MPIYGVVYTSNTGHTKEYAEIVGRRLNVPVQELNSCDYPEKSEIVYLGWVSAGKIVGLNKVKKKYTVLAAIAVGINTGADDDKVCAKAKVKTFVVQGGLSMDKLTGFKKFIMKIVRNRMIKNLEKIPSRNQKEENTYQTLTTGKNLVSEENLSDFFEWLSNH